MWSIDTTQPAPRVVAGMVLGSSLSMIDPDGEDARLRCFLAGSGTWALARQDAGTVVGIACLVPVDDAPGQQCLLWLEVRPQARGMGIGRALLAWARATAPHLRIDSAEAAIPFYRACLPGAVDVDGRFVI